MSFKDNFNKKSPITYKSKIYTDRENQTNPPNKNNTKEKFSPKQTWEEQRKKYAQYLLDTEQYKKDSTSYVEKNKAYEKFQNTPIEYPDYYAEGAKWRRGQYANAIDFIKGQSRSGKSNPKIDYNVLHSHPKYSHRNATDQETMLKNFLKTYVPKPKTPIKPTEVKNPGSSYKTKPTTTRISEYEYIGPGSFSRDPVTRKLVRSSQTGSYRKFE